MVQKIITFNVALKSTERQWVQKIPEVYTNDLGSVSIKFNITDCTDTELTGSSAIVLLKMRDGSFFQGPSVDVERTLNVFSYTLKENEGNHDGLAEIQLIVTISGKEFATQKYQFKVNSGLDSEVAREIMIYDWTTLTAEARAYITQFTADEMVRDAEFDNNEFDRNTAFVASQDARTLAFGNAQTNRVMAFTSAQNARTAIFNNSESGRATAESARVTAEAARVTEYNTLADDLVATLNAADANIEEFDIALQTGIVATNIETKLTELETTYSPRLLSAERQLEQTQSQFNQAVGAVTEDSEVVLARNEYPTLKERLDAEWDNVNAQLADKVQNFKLKNEVLNGDFITDTSWGKGSAWSISNGKATSIGVTAQYLTQPNVFKNTTNKHYFKFDIVDYTSGALSTLTAHHSTAGGPWSGIGVKSYVTVPKGNYIYLYQTSFIGAVDNFVVIDLTLHFGVGNEPTKLEMDELIKIIPNQWWDGELSLTQKQFITWQLNLIRKNTNAIIALGGTII